jgi:hypothetical protein
VFLQKSHLHFRNLSWGFSRKILRASGACLGLLVLATLSTALSLAAQKADTSTAPQPATTPQVVISARMASNDLQVLDIKYRLFYNKFENKFITLTDFNMAANLTDELLNALVDDKRATWRGTTADERQKLEACYGPKSWKEKAVTLPPIEADRVLLINAAYSASIHFSGHRLDLAVALRMADRKTGRILWKKVIIEKGELPGTLEEIQADNQKPVKEALNKLMEQVVPKVKQHIAQSQL